MAGPVIYCPACAWPPDGEAHWECSRSGCGTVWDTFTTRGRCPGCGYQWRNTSCPDCGEMSPHLAWYHDPDSRDAPARGTELAPELEAMGEK